MNFYDEKDPSKGERPYFYGEMEHQIARNIEALEGYKQLSTKERRDINKMNLDFPWLKRNDS